MARHLTFTVQRRETELIRPAGPTPHEYKRLSDIDDQESFRFQVSLIQFYRHNPAMKGRDPVQAIRDGLARALVYYYPFAGRLREWEGRKLVVECTGEGVMFTEADADIRLEQFGDVIQPPFPNLDELLFDVPGSGGILDCPLLLIQVTRLKCGAFITALRFNHTMTDGSGIGQFLNAVGEMSRGATSPSVLPVWQRELLDARNPPRVTCTHHEYDQVTGAKSINTVRLDGDMVERSFFFGRAEIAAIRKSVPQHLRSCSTFDVLTACLWRCRTKALQPDPNEEMRIMCIFNARTIKFNPPLHAGYYGNAFAFPAAVASAGKLCQNPLGYTLELVKKVRGEMTEEYIRSVADLMVKTGRPHFTVPGSYVVSHLVRVGIDETDFGWGKPVFAGTAGADITGLITFYVPGRNREGEKGILIPVRLPVPAMKRFVEALESILQGREIVDNPKSVVSSAL